MLKCRGKCGLEKPWTRRYFRPGGKPDTLRTTCKKCEDQRRREGNKQKQLLTVYAVDFAQIYCAHTLPQKTQGRECTVDAFSARALLALQQYSCAVSGRPFAIPTLDEARSCKKLKTWIQALPEDKRGDVPVMVRVLGARTDGAWEPGNVLFIAARFEELYLASGGLFAFRQLVTTLMNRMSDISVPQAATLYAVGLDELERLRMLSIENNRATRAMKKDLTCENPTSGSSSTDPAAPAATPSAPGPA